QHDIGKAFKLAAIEVTVRAERAMPAAIGLAENVDLAAFVVPGVIGLRENAAVLPVDLEPFMPVHAHGDRQVEMADRTVGEDGGDEPAIGAIPLVEPGLAPLEGPMRRGGV